MIRDWTVMLRQAVLTPYDAGRKLVLFERLSIAVKSYRTRLSLPLRMRQDFGSVSYEEAGKPWWQWHQLTESKYVYEPRLGLGFVATHVHLIALKNNLAVKQTVRIALP